ncbi:MAG: glycosyltransferase [Bacteroidia bacterium]
MRLYTFFLSLFGNYAAFFVLLAMLYYVYVVLRATIYAKKLPISAQSSLPFVSVIIAARNEAANIEKCLTSILAQDYPKEHFEIWLIDDASEDETYALVEKLAQKHTHLHLLAARKFSKKAAISEGVSRAKGEIILQTDADCEVTSNWLSSIVPHFEANTALISAPVFLGYPNFSFFEKLQSLEFMGLNLLGGGSMNSGNANMCNGANLAYRKKVFEEVGGFQGIDQVASGDDELLLQKILALKTYQVKYVYDEKAIVRTPAQTTFRDFWQQRLRWVSKARYYTNRWVNLTQLIFAIAITGVPFLAFFGQVQAAFFLFSLKCLADIFLMYKATHFFREKPLFFYFFFPLQLAYYLYVPSIAVMGNFVNQYEWKGRKVK